MLPIQLVFKIQYPIPLPLDLLIRIRDFFKQGLLSVDLLITEMTGLLLQCSECIGYFVMGSLQLNDLRLNNEVFVLCSSDILEVRVLSDEWR